MKRIILSLALVMGICAVSLAQPGRGDANGGRMGNPEERAKRSVESLEKELKLDAAQKDSIYKFELANAQVQQQLFEKGRTDGNVDRQKIMGQMQVLREEIDKKIKGVLKEDQVKKYEELVKERQSRMQQRRQ